MASDSPIGRCAYIPCGQAFAHDATPEIHRGKPYHRGCLDDHKSTVAMRAESLRAEIFCATVALTMLRIRGYRAGSDGHAEAVRDIHREISGAIDPSIAVHYSKVFASRGCPERCGRDIQRAIWDRNEGQPAF